MISIEQIYENILTQKFTWVKISDTDNDVVGSLCNSQNHSVSPIDIKNFISEFIRSTPGIYTFQFKKHTTAHKSSIITYKKVICQSATTPMNINFDYEEERKRIREQLESEEREKKAKIDYEARAAELETSAGALGYVMMKLFSQFGVIPKGNLQGTIQQQNTMGTNSDAPIPLDKLTPQQKEIANIAFAKILSVMSPELFSQIADKIASNPDKISVIKTFL